MTVSEEIISRLDGLGVKYDLMSHPPTATMEDCLLPMRELGGLMPKNIFLTTKSRKVHCLCVTRPEAVYHASLVSRQTGTPRLSFAPEDELYAFLRTLPGAVSPLGLLLDEAKDVRLLMDENLKDEKRLIFHPCDNPYSLAVSGEDFFGRIVPATGREITWVSMSSEEELNKSNT